jgi:plastocyanin
MGEQPFNKIIKTVIILVAIFFVATLTAASVSAAAVNSSAPGYTVDIKGSTLSPSSVTIQKDNYVGWTNKEAATSKIDHEVKSISGPDKFDSGTLHPGQSYSFQFKNTGTTTYKDVPTNTQGTVIVK